jgi:shikimate kinase
VATGNIFLVGMMGAGKTTIGRALARKLGLAVAQADKELVAVATIFEIEGEAGFRKRESALLVELAAGENSVIATGGGVVLAEENRKVMRERGTVVYLRARVESLWERTRHDSSRPLLATPDPWATLATLLEQREPLYLEVAHLVVDTGPQSPSALATRLAATLREQAGSA